MSRERDDLLADIKEAAERAVRHVRGLSRERFLVDEKSVDAVIRCLQIVGEAAKRVSAADRAALPHLPWRAMTGLRDRLVHDYLGTDPEIVWDVVTVQLPALLASPPFPGIASDQEG